MNENLTALASAVAQKPARPPLTPEMVSDVVRRAIKELNACCMSCDGAGNISFKVKDAGQAAYIEPLIHAGLKELGMGRGCRFINLCPAAVERLKPLGLDVRNAYNLTDAKGAAQTITRVGDGQGFGGR